MIPIREYNDATDREHVIALWRTAFGYDTAHNLPSLVIDRKLAVRDQLFFVAEEEGAVIGTTMAGYDGHRGWLYSVSVHPDWQRDGLGARLVAHAERALKELGCVKINLQLVATNAAVARFYESLGYVLEPRISMGKVIRENAS